MTSQHSEELFAEACRVIPGGVSSPVRAWGAVGGTPRFIKSASGPWVFDVDDNRYVDLVGSWGPAILGHAHPDVVAAVQAAASRGLSFGAPTGAEVELAELICQKVPGLQMVRLVSTGTEATMTAIRLARAVSGRDLLVKFIGCYHGHSDSLLVAAGSGLATTGRPSSAGVPDAVANATIVLPYNDVAALEALFAERGSQIAAVITESAAANMGLVPPNPGFNAAIRRLTKQHGALMICDEVLTGFRCSPAGFWAIDQQPEPWFPDIFTFGKVIGGGMPLAALAATTEVMSELSPTGPVYQAGTLSGNPLATAAGIATLSRVDDSITQKLQANADQVIACLEAELTKHSVPFKIQRAASLFSVFFGAEVVAGVPDFATASKQDLALHKAFFHGCLDGGALLPPSAFESWFVSAAHDEEALAAIEQAIACGAKAAGQAVGR